MARDYMVIFDPADGTGFVLDAHYYEKPGYIETTFREEEAGRTTTDREFRPSYPLPKIPGRGKQQLARGVNSLKVMYHEGLERLVAARSDVVVSKEGKEVVKTTYYTLSHLTRPGRKWVYLTTVTSGRYIPIKFISKSSIQFYNK